MSECTCEIKFDGYDIDGIDQCPLCKAAPELYVALKDAVNWMEAQINEMEDVTWNDVIELQDALAALAEVDNAS